MPSRTRISLDGQWYFSTEPIVDTDACPLIDVPSPWQADSRFRDHTGEAWYRREFQIPESWFKNDRVIILGFGAVDYFADVWVNDVKVGSHEGGYLPFHFDVTLASRPGTNTVVVRVDDPLEIFHEIPHGKQSWYGMLSGIWQPVWVESRARTHIERVKITTSPDSVHVALALNDVLPPGQALEIEVLDPAGTAVARAQTSSLRSELRVSAPELWDIDSPNLYTLKVTLGADEVWETFGFRTIETRDGQILLNGRPFYMRAALDQDYHPDLIATLPSQEYVEDQLRKAKDMGLNCLRVHIKVADPRYYAAADRLGLLIWTELPNHVLLSDDAKRRARETLLGMVERDGNHPSIGIWTIINESWGIDLTDPSQRLWLAETYEWLKALDPARLVVGNSACWGNFHVATDIADFHIYYAMPDHHRQWRAWTAGYAQRPRWLFAHDYEDHAGWRDFEGDPWREVDRPPVADVRQRGDEPLLISEFGNWGLPDVSRLYEENGGTEPWWFDTGLEWGDGVVYPHGVAQRFEQYHLARVFPSLTALCEASQRLQFDALKFEIENIRSHKSIQGYVITELTDLHWECNGLLDLYRNPKVYHARLKEINATDLLIPAWERLSYRGGETAAIKILFSHFSEVEIRNCVLEWELAGDFPSDGRRRRPCGDLSPFGVAELGTVTFAIPQVDYPTKARLKIHLRSDGNPIGTAEQSLYVFPSGAADGLGGGLRREDQIYAPEFEGILKGFGFRCAGDLTDATLAVVTTLDDSCREFLLGGGRVLFLAEAEASLQTHIPGLGIESRAGTPWQGDWASSFGWHRFDAIPTDNVVDFAFADLTPETVIRGFAPREFALDVFAGLFVGWLHKPVPIVARRRVGRGELWISTFRLSQNLETNPLAACLFSELLKRILQVNDAAVTG